MLPPRAFPLSPANSNRALVLLASYGILVIASAVAYIVLSGDQRPPVHFLLLLAIISVSAWGIYARYRWAWAVAALLAAWSIYSGPSNIWPFIKAGVVYVPVTGQIIFGGNAL